MRDSRTSQRAKILQLLNSARGDWVPLPRIADHAKQYNARLFELRRLGLHIENKTTMVDGVRHSWFRLAIVSSVTRKESEAARDIQSIPATSGDHLHAGVNPTLFGNIEPFRSYRE